MNVKADEKRLSKYRYTRQLPSQSTGNYSLWV